MANKVEFKKHGKIKNFVKNIVLVYSPSDFQAHFRLTKTNFEELLSVFQRQEISCNIRKPAYPLLDSLLLTIWALATQEGFREIGSRFDLSEGHAYRILMKFCIKMTNMCKIYIIWPKGEELESHLQDFNKLRGENSFPGVFGCLDGTQIPIPGPSGDNSYYNRKGFHSIQVQAICDSRARFINVFSGWPGSAHDARVWCSSKLHEKLENDALDLLPPGTYLLGDSAYPLATYLLTPFKDNGHLTRQQKRYNTKLSSTRDVIEQAFGRLKGMFRRLKFLNVTNLSNAKYIITAACVSHNICIGNEVELENTDEIDPEDNDTPDSENLLPGSQEAVQLRNEIMNKIC